VRTLVSQSYALANHTHPSTLPGDGDTGAFNAVSYGVDNTGSKDVTAITESFFAAAVAAGKPAYFPPGTYVMSEAVVPANCRLTGAGSATVLKRVAGSASSAVLAVNGSDVTVADLTLDGARGTGGETTAGSIVYTSASDVSRFRAERVTVQNAEAIGFWVIDPERQITVTDCDFVDMESTAVLVECFTGAVAPHGVEVSRCRVSATANAAYGIVARSNTGPPRSPEMFDVRIIDNYIDLPGNYTSGGFGGYGIEVWATNATVAGNVVAYDSSTTGDEVGLSIVSTAAAVTGNVVVNAGLGVEAGGTDCLDVSVTGNVLRNCRQGVMSFGTPIRVLIANNTVEGFTEYGIITSRDSVVSGNMLSGTASTVAGNTFGIWLTSASYSGENPSVTGNVVDIADVGPGDALRVGFRVEETLEFVLSGNSVVSADYGVYLTGLLGQTHVGVVVGNDLAGATFPYVKGGASTDSTVRWANRGDEPSRAAFASTDALLIARGVIVA
jgi:hypothetical protein